MCLLTFLIGVGIWGFWRDLRNGWEYSTRLKSQNAVIVTCSDVFGVMCLTSVSVVNSILRWKRVQVVIDKLVDVSFSKWIAIIFLRSIVRLLIIALDFMVR